MSEEIDARERGSIWSGTLELKETVFTYTTKRSTAHYDWAAVEKVEFDKENLNSQLIYALVLLPTSIISGVGLYVLSSSIKSFASKMPETSVGIGFSGMLDSLVGATQLMSGAIGGILLLMGVYFLAMGILRRGHNLKLTTKSGSTVFQVPSKEAGEIFLEYYEQKGKRDEGSQQAE